jgi:hypothetical protein
LILVIEDGGHRNSFLTCDFKVSKNPHHHDESRFLTWFSNSYKCHPYILRLRLPDILACSLG